MIASRKWLLAALVVAVIACGAWAMRPRSVRLQVRDTSESDVAENARDTTEPRPGQDRSGAPPASKSVASSPGYEGTAVRAPSSDVVAAPASAPTSTHSSATASARAGGSAVRDQGDGGAEAGAPRRLHKLDRDGIKNAVSAVLPEVHECYEGWLKSSPGLAGVMRVHMVIEADPDDDSQGVVRSAELLDSELDHPAVEGCLLNALSEPLFEPPAKGSVEVNYPFEFAPESE